MATGKQKLNSEKTAFILFGSKGQSDLLKTCFSIDVLVDPLHLADSVKKLAVWFDSDVSLS